MSDHSYYSDQDIIDLLSSEDIRKENLAVSDLLKRFYPKVQVLASRLGGNGYVDVKIILDDAVFAIVQKIKTGSFSLEKGSIAGLFHTIASNRILNAIRSGKKYEQHKQNFEFGAFADEPGDYELTEKNIAVMEQAIRNLPSKCRKLLISYWYKGISLKEWAQRKGKTAPAVRQQHRRCLEKLKAMIRKINDAKKEN